MSRPIPLGLVFPPATDRIDGEHRPLGKKRRWPGPYVGVKGPVGSCVATEEPALVGGSARLRRVLLGRGAIVNREVQVRRNRPSGIGERTDLLADAATNARPDTGRLSVPVEVKGAWNSELCTAMSDQLLDRYMRDVGATDGIYVVVWPDLASWTDVADDRGKVLASLDREAIEAQLAEQAADLARQHAAVRVVHLEIAYRRPA